MDPSVICALHLLEDFEIKDNGSSSVDSAVFSLLELFSTIIRIIQLDKCAGIDGMNVARVVCENSNVYYGHCHMSYTSSKAPTIFNSRFK